MTAPVATTQTVDLRCAFGNQTRLKCPQCTRFIKDSLMTGRIECRCGAVYFADGAGLWQTRTTS